MVARVKSKRSAVSERDERVLDLYAVLLRAQGMSPTLLDQLTRGARLQIENGGRDHDGVVGLRAVLEVIESCGLWAVLEVIESW